MRYNNYHKHTHYSNLRTIDSIAKPIDYINRAVELGHTTYFTTEHGFQGNIYEAFTLCQEKNLKCIYGVEAYYVNDITQKDRSNFHLMLIAMTEHARREINKIMSIANTDGFYYKPRIDKNLLLSLNPNETIITTACVAGPLFKEKTDNSYDWFNDFFIPVKNYFGKNFYLEVQDHLDEKQIEYNKQIIELHMKYKIPIIHANDSHYIYPEDSKFRDLFLKAKGINYPEENGFCLDYPDSDEIYKRYKMQGVLTEEQVTEALNNTLIFDNAEGIFIDKEFKIPKVTDEDGNTVLKRLLNDGWKRERKKIPKEKWNIYKRQIRYEEKIVEDCGMADYFILDHMVVNRAVDKYGAILTRSGRGSSVSFYINKLLGLTEVDRISAPITLYPTRFMSAERILSSRSLPDIDLNFADVAPVVQASKDILGEDGIYYMVAYKPLQESSAFRLWCKANGMNIDEYNDIAKDLDSYINDDKWSKIIDDSKIFRGVIESVAPSPCSFLLSNDKISEMVGLIKVGDEICCCLDGYNCDVYKFLKNDYLTVAVYRVIDQVYKLLGRPIDNIEILLQNCDNKVWDLYAKGLTTTINQADSDYDKQILKKYKPKNLAELSAYVAAIRPGFSSLLDNFVERKPYTTGVKDLDDILKDSFHYLMYQESIMKYLVWLGIEEKGTYDIIKKIAKKKFKEAELNELKETLKNGWIEKVGIEDGFAETWQVVQDAAHYSFNASHSLCVALDSLYGAYLKSHYPLEYFTVTLSLYSNDLDRTAKLISEMKYFNIKLKPIKFRYSISDYNMDKESNSIYKGVGAIKYMNSDVADSLYKLKDEKFDSFIDLLNVFPGNSRQLEILIKLGYFSEFGKTLKLIKISELYNMYHGKKIIKKENMKITEDLAKQYSESETAKQYRFSLDGMDNLISYISSKIPDQDIPLRTRLEAEEEYLGYISYTNAKLSNIGMVLDINTKYTPKLNIYMLSTGQTITVKLSKMLYQKNPVCKGNIIKFVTHKKQKCKKVNDEWVKCTETEDWIKSYVIKESDL